LPDHIGFHSIRGCPETGGQQIGNDSACPRDFFTTAAAANAEKTRIPEPETSVARLFLD
jgi:hypothetical protein